MKWKTLVFAVICSAIGLSSLEAQPLPNPTRVEFTSVDHSTVDGSGNPILTSYLIEYYQVGATSPMTSNELAKTLATLVEVSGCVNPCYRVLFSALPSYPVGVVFQAKVVSKGPGGTAASNLTAESFIKPVPAPAAPAGLRVVQ